MKREEKTAFSVGVDCYRRRPLFISWVRWHLERRPLADWERELLNLPVPFIQRLRRK